MQCVDNKNANLNYAPLTEKINFWYVARISVCGGINENVHGHLSPNLMGKT